MRSSRGGPPTCSPRRAGWPSRACASSFLVSENSTSYGKDLGDLRLLETLLPELAAVDGIDRVRVTYLQPAEMRPSLVEVMTATPGVAAVLRPVLPARQRVRAAADAPLRRHASASSSCSTTVRAAAPEAGVRSNVIVGFPGETEDDLAELERFLTLARLDAIGVFGYSDEDGTEAAGLDGKLDEDVVARAGRASVAAGRGADRAARRGARRRAWSRCWSSRSRRPASVVEGRAAHQAPEVDGSTTVSGARTARSGRSWRRVVVATDGVDLVAGEIVRASRVTEPVPGRASTRATRPVSVWNIAERA